MDGQFPRSARQRDAPGHLVQWRPHHRRPGNNASASAEPALEALLPAEALAAIDLFDQLQLASVIRICRASSSLSDAGRQLYQASRAQRSVVNDADRLRKYLHKFGLSWERITG